VAGVELTERAVRYGCMHLTDPSRATVTVVAPGTNRRHSRAVERDDEENSK
jgi:hypothetical protein